MSSGVVKQYLQPNMQFLQLPPELSLEILRTFTIQELLTTRLLCKYYQNFVDTEPSLQTKINHYSLMQMQSRYNIPLDDLKMYMSQGKLLVQANGNLCLWKLTNQPELNFAISRISHLFIKEGKPNELMTLFTQLLQNNRLSVLYLFNCELDGAALEKLQPLLTPVDQNLRPLHLYLCNLHLSDCELPPHLSNCSNVKMIVTDKADEYSIEKILSKDSDLEDILDLEKQVQNEDLPAEMIVKKMNELNPAIQAGIVTSIWYSSLFPSSPVPTPSLPRNVVKLRVFEFVCENPHHAALKAAISNNGKIFMKNCGSNGCTSS